MIQITKKYSNIKEKINREKIIKITAQENLKPSNASNQRLQLSTNHDFYKKLIILTRIQEDEKKRKILERNTKYHPNQNTKNHNNIIHNLINTETAVQNLKFQDSDCFITVYRYRVIEIIDKQLKPLIAAANFDSFFVKCCKLYLPV